MPITMKFFFLYLLINTHVQLGEVNKVEIPCYIFASSDNLDEICQLTDSKKFSKMNFCFYERPNFGVCFSKFDFCFSCPRSKSLALVENSSYVFEVSARFYAGNLSN